MTPRSSKDHGTVCNVKWLHAEAGLKTHASNLPNPQRGGGTYNRKCTFQQPCLAARVEHIGDLSCVSAVHCLRQSLLHARSRRLHHPLQHECFFQPLYHPTLPCNEHHNVQFDFKELRAARGASVVATGAHDPHICRTTTDAYLGEAAQSAHIIDRVNFRINFAKREDDAIPKPTQLDHGLCTMPGQLLAKSSARAKLRHNAHVHLKLLLACECVSVL